MTKRAATIHQLAKLSRVAATRARINDVTARAAALAPFPLVYAVVGICLIKVLHAPPALVRGLAWGALGPGLLFVIGVLHAALRHKPPLGGALALDRHHGLHDRVASALAFAALGEGERSPMMRAAIDDALAVASDLSPRRAVPLRVPRDLVPALLLLGAAAGLAQLEVPVTRTLPPPKKAVEALAISPDDVELFRRMAEDLEAKTKDPETLANARRFNQLVEDLAERRIDRREVFRRLDELERGTSDPLALNDASLDESLEGIARELDKAAMSKPVAQALAEKRLADAEQAMKDLADRVEKAKKDVDRQKLEQLRQSLQKAAEVAKKEPSKASEAERKHLEEQRKKLLQKKQKEGLSKDEQKELDKTERRLERLNREKAQGDAAREKLSGLDKDLAKAADDLMKELGLGADDLRSAAQDINRAGQQRATEEQKREMKRRIEEMRQILRQEGQAGRERLKRMLQFAERARGQQGGDQGQKGQQGQGEGKDGKGQGQGKGKDGQGKQLVFGQGSQGEGNGLLLRPGASAGSESGGKDDPGGGDPGGDEPGTGHDPGLRGEASRLKGQTADVTAAAADTGQGASSSTVIYGAAERGFVGRGYKKVFTDYQNVAEESLAKDDIPSGYRFYVRRYFQLIRPRD